MRWTSPTGLGLLAAFMLPVMVLAIVSIISVRQRADTRRLLVEERHRGAADLLAASLDEAMSEWESELLAELDAGRWDSEGLLQTLHSLEHAFPEMRPVVMLDPSGAVIYPVRAQVSPAFSVVPVNLMRAALNGDDVYNWLMNRGREIELAGEDFGGAERLYRRAGRVADSEVARVQAQNALARTHLKAAEPDQATAVWTRMLDASNPLDPELSRWNLIARIGLAEAARSQNDDEKATSSWIQMLEFLIDHRLNLDPDLYEFYRRQVESSLAELPLKPAAREKVAALLDQDEELNRIEDALRFLVRQAPQLGAIDGTVVTAPAADSNISLASDADVRLAADWTVAHLSFPGDQSGSTVIAARGQSGYRLLLRWRPDNVRGVLRPLLLKEGPWRGYGISLLDSGRGIVFASTPTVPEDRVMARVDLAALPGWRIAAYPRAGTIEDAARQDVRDYSVLLGAAFLAVVGGLVLATRTMSREVALARTRSDFVSNVSHELKTPLALIRMFAENLRAGWVPDDKRAEYYDVMLGESERLTAVIDNVLDFSRMESGRREFHFRPTDLTALVSGIVERYRHTFESAGIKLSSVIPEHAIVAAVDRDAMAQVLVNLLSNAAKYIGEGTKHVMVSLAENEARVLLVVRDTGVGMTNESVREIFAPFTRLDAPEVKSIAGSGIGLAIVRHIVDAHSGRIEVASRPQTGSTFRIRLPKRRRRRRGDPESSSEGTP